MPSLGSSNARNVREGERHSSRLFEVEQCTPKASKKKKKNIREKGAENVGVGVGMWGRATGAEQ